MILYHCNNSRLLFLFPSLAPSITSIVAPHRNAHSSLRPGTRIKPLRVVRRTRRWRVPPPPRPLEEVPVGGSPLPERSAVSWTVLVVRFVFFLDLYFGPSTADRGGGSSVERRS